MVYNALIICQSFFIDGNEKSPVKASYCISFRMGELTAFSYHHDNCEHTIHFLYQSLLFHLYTCKKPFFSNVVVAKVHLS